eukprot:scaffold4425_cov194-Alexandrium_tamarense.AAC.10
MPSVFNFRNASRSGNTRNNNGDGGLMVVDGAKNQQPQQQTYQFTPQQLAQYQQQNMQLQSGQRAPSPQVQHLNAQLNANHNHHHQVGERSLNSGPVKTYSEERNESEAHYTAAVNNSRGGGGSEREAPPPSSNASLSKFNQGYSTQSQQQVVSPTTTIGNAAAATAARDYAMRATNAAMMSKQPETPTTAIANAAAAAAVASAKGGVPMGQRTTSNVSATSAPSAVQRRKQRIITPNMVKRRNIITLPLVMKSDEDGTKKNGAEGSSDVSVNESVNTEMTEKVSNSREGRRKSKYIGGLKRMDTIESKGTMDSSVGVVVESSGSKETDTVDVDVPSNESLVSVAEYTIAKEAGVVGAPTSSAEMKASYEKKSSLMTVAEYEMASSANNNAPPTTKNAKQLTVDTKSIASRNPASNLISPPNKEAVEVTLPKDSASTVSEEEIIGSGTATVTSLLKYLWKPESKNTDKEEESSSVAVVEHVVAVAVEEELVVKEEMEDEESVGESPKSKIVVKDEASKEETSPSESSTADVPATSKEASSVVAGDNSGTDESPSSDLQEDSVSSDGKGSSSNEQSSLPSSKASSKQQSRTSSRAASKQFNSVNDSAPKVDANPSKKSKSSKKKKRGALTSFLGKKSKVIGENEEYGPEDQPVEAESDGIDIHLQATLSDAELSSVQSSVTTDKAFDQTPSIIKRTSSLIRNPMHRKKAKDEEMEELVKRMKHGKSAAKEDNRKKEEFDEVIPNTDESYVIVEKFVRKKTSKEEEENYYDEVVHDDTMVSREIVDDTILSERGVSFVGSSDESSEVQALVSKNTFESLAKQVNLPDVKDGTKLEMKSNSFRLSAVSGTGIDTMPSPLAQHVRFKKAAIEGGTQMLSSSNATQQSYPMVRTVSSGIGSPMRVDSVDHATQTSNQPSDNKAFGAFSDVVESVALFSARVCMGTGAAMVNCADSCSDKPRKGSRNAILASNSFVEGDPSYISPRNAQSDNIFRETPGGISHAQSTEEVMAKALAIALRQMPEEEQVALTRQLSMKSNQERGKSFEEVEEYNDQAMSVDGMFVPAKHGARRRKKRVPRNIAVKPKEGHKKREHHHHVEEEEESDPIETKRTNSTRKSGKKPGALRAIAKGIKGLARTRFAVMYEV